LREERNMVKFKVFGNKCERNNAYFFFWGEGDLNEKKKEGNKVFNDAIKKKRSVYVVIIQLFT
jgi:hypothetical protein